MMDADLSHPPDRINELLSPLFADAADLVVGSRYVRGGSTPGWPIWRRDRVPNRCMPSPAAGLASRTERLAIASRRSATLNMALPHVP